ncbi:PREDICTED: uncharacterized protein LOC105566332 [Vollenhovia emeryi]|uniref:uncharacterized protein LOC105566332 n=1 Tax=Vollenhovia emeryi TaxID=411798 RepID=UPI0005F3F5B9|nr:PREDICTED: uncharacterized protein LOC105566332 [Vollenhovia emeryi]
MSVHKTVHQTCLISERKTMKLFELLICLMAIAMVAYANTIADIALYGGSLSTADLQQCYEFANLTEADVITHAEIKDGSYKNSENAEKLKKSGCLTLCILRKRGQIIDSEIQTNKLYGKLANALLKPGMQAEMYATINRCVDQVKTTPDMCDKSFNLLTCIWKDLI